VSQLRYLAGLGPHFRKRLVRALDTGLLARPYSVDRLRAAVGRADTRVLGALEQLAALGVADRGAAAWIRSVAEVERRRQWPDLVWTGPPVSGLHARATRSVYEELFGSAERSLWAVSYAWFDGPRVFDGLARRMEARSELTVRLLLNVHPSGAGSSSAPEDVLRTFAEQFWAREWPGRTRPEVYYDPRSLDPGSRGKLHAKAVVADDERLFVTSATPLRGLPNYSMYVAARGAANA